MLHLCYFYLVDCILCIHFNIHGHEKGKKEQNTAGEGHQFAGGKFSVRTNSGLNIAILKLKSN